MSSFLLDLHCHTLDHSYDGQVPAAKICRTLLAKGFHGLVLTDHNYVWPTEELAELRAIRELLSEQHHQRLEAWHSLPPTQRMAREPSMRIERGRNAHGE